MDKAIQDALPALPPKLFWRIKMRASGNYGLYLCRKFSFAFLGFPDVYFGVTIDDEMLFDPTPYQVDLEGRRILSRQKSKMSLKDDPYIGDYFTTTTKDKK